MFKCDYLMSVIDKYTYRDENGKAYQKDILFDYLDTFIDGYAIIKLKHKYNVINVQGEYITDMWFDKILLMDNIYRLCIYGKGYNYMDRKGKLLSDVWFDKA